MPKYHAKNERIKREYLIYLKDAKKLSAQSVFQAAAALTHFETAFHHKDFAQFRIENARRYKDSLAEYICTKTGKPLAKATIHSRLMALKAFFTWLAGQPGYKSKLRYSDADYFNPSHNDTRIAKATYEKRIPTIEEIRKTLFLMPTGSALEKRDRAVIAFILLSGARDNAVASLCLKHVDCVARKIYQEGRDVRTKNRKTFTSLFFPVGQDIEDIVIEWIDYLKTECQFGADDPLFPATHVGVGKSGYFEALGLDRTLWANATPIRQIFNRAFTAAGFPYFNPHSFRKTLTLLGQSEFCKTPEEYKAWSQNLGHDHVMTTLTSYGTVATHRQAEIFQRLAEPRDYGQVTNLPTDALLQELKRRTG